MKHENPNQSEYDQAASDLARRYREAPTDGTRAAIMLGARRFLSVEIVESLLAQHSALVEALEAALRVSESWVHDQLDGTDLLDDALSELDPCHAALAKARGEVAS